MKETEQLIQSLSEFVSYMVEPLGGFPFYYATEADSHGRRDFLCLKSEIECENVNEVDGTVHTLDEMDSMIHFDLHSEGRMFALDFYPCSELEYWEVKKKVENVSKLLAA